MLDQWAGKSAKRYLEFVARVVADPSRFDDFRANKHYRQIVETVSAEDGLKMHKALSNEAIQEIVLGSERADRIGNPKTIKVDGKSISPTTLRYGLTLSDVIAEFPDFSNVESICEIGVGYGGLARLICELHARESGSLSRYRMFDLPEVLQLARRYLEHFHLHPRFEYMTKSQVGTRNSDQYDFLVSNWAFSELSRDLQVEYLDKVIRKAKAGYLIMNTGLDGRSVGYGGRPCLTDKEIIDAVPKGRVANPDKAQPKGYVIAFGDAGGSPA
jgi:putative sugar O-methyltransferase